MTHTISAAGFISLDRRIEFALRHSDDGMTWYLRLIYRLDLRFRMSRRIVHDFIATEQELQAAGWPIGDAFFHQLADYEIPAGAGFDRETLLSLYLGCHRPFLGCGPSPRLRVDPRAARFLERPESFKPAFSHQQPSPLHDVRDPDGVVSGGITERQLIVQDRLRAEMARGAQPEQALRDGRAPADDERCPPPVLGSPNSKLPTYKGK